MKWFAGLLYLLAAVWGWMMPISDDRPSPVDEASQTARADGN